MFFISFVGIILLLALATFPLWRTFMPNNAFKEKLKEKKFYVGALVFAFVLSLTNWLFFTSAPGYQYFIVYPWGNKDAVVDEGVKFAPFATTIQEWNKNIDIKTVAKDPSHATDFNSEEGLDELEGVMNPIDIRFIDQVTGTMNVTTRFTIPIDKDQFIAFAIKYRNITNLVHNTLIPTISEQAKNTGFMYAAQDYISGAGQSFKQTFEEQLENGAYVVYKEERRDSIYDEIVNQDVTKPGLVQRHLKEVQIAYVVSKVLDENHKPKIIPNEISLSGITVSQVIVDNVVPDPEYQQRLKDQKGESAKRQLEQQKITTARIEQQRIIAEGEVKKADERVAQEVEQVKTLIPFETQKQKEAALLESSKIAKERAAVEAETKLITERAQAESNRLKVAAGLTPQERAEWEYKTKTEVAKALGGPNGIGSNVKMIVGGEGGKDGLMSTIVGASLAEKLLDKP